MATRILGLAFVALAVSGLFIWRFVRPRRVAPPIRGQGVEIVYRQEQLGTLKVVSGKIVAADPSYVAKDRVLVDGIPPGDYPVILTVGRMNEDQRVFVASVMISDDEPTEKILVDSVPVDSATACFIDELVHRQHYKEVGPDSIGEFYCNNHEKLAKAVKHRFGLEYTIISETCSRISEPVTEEQSRQIYNYLKRLERYPGYRRRTNSTQDLIMDGIDRTYVPTYGAVSLILDEASGANMVAFSSGYGDGYYGLYACYRDGGLVRVELDMRDE